MQPYDEDDRPTIAGGVWQDNGDQVETRVSDRPAVLGPVPSSHKDPQTIVQRPAPEMASVAWFYCRKGLRKGTLYQFRSERSEFGRAADNDISIEDDFSSAHHGAVTLEGGEWKIYDFASTNGTFVNDSRLGTDQSNPTVLNDGDSVRVGDTELVFKRI
jgi:hypothetical protein